MQLISNEMSTVASFKTDVNGFTRHAKSSVERHDCQDADAFAHRRIRVVDTLETDAFGD